MMGVMKQRSTTPAVKGIVTKSSLVAAAVVMAFATPITFGQQVLADRYDEQISALRAEVSGYQAKAADLRQQAGTLAAALEILTAEKNTIQRQVDLSQAKYDKLVHDIAETEKDIADNKDALGQIIADMYVDGSITPLEMLASSKNIGDYVDQQEYRSSIQSNLSATIKEINTLKKKLEDQKKEVERVLADQKSQRDQLAAKEAEQAKLLADTRGEEAAYQQLSVQRNAQISQLQAQQAAELAARARQVGGYTASSDGSNGGYPSLWANAPMNSYIDDWGMYSRQCVSYVAFKVANTYGNMPNWGGIGNANEWPRNARNGARMPGGRVIPTGTTPKVGSVGVVSSGQYGHVAWVEAVNPNGTIRISHYNVNWTGNYAVWDNLSPSYFDTYIYFGEWR